MGNLGSIALSLLITTVMIVVTVTCWLATLFGLPGNWAILLTSLLYDWLVPDGSPRELGWTVIGLLAALAIIGEIIEFAAGAVGVKSRGGSALSAGLALVGSFAGALVGAAITIPIPVIGSVIGVLLGSSAGAMLGAVIGEDVRGQSPSDSISVGWGAFWARLWGTVGKALIGAVMVALVLGGMVL